MSLIFNKIYVETSSGVASPVLSLDKIGEQNFPIIETFVNYRYTATPR